MRELILYILAVAYLVVGGLAIMMILGLAVLWIRYGLIRLFPNTYKKMVRRKRERLLDKYMRSFEK